MKMQQKEHAWMGLGAALVVCAGGLWSPPAAQAAGFANTAQSGTATGMGGVATANADEPNANFYNPAAMVFSQGFSAYVGPTLIKPSVSYEGQGGEEQTEPALFPPPNVNLTLPFGEQYAVGLGVTLPWGLAIRWPDNWVGRENFRAQQLQTINVNPNFAYKVPGMDLGLAVGVQAMYSTITQERTVILRDDLEVPVLLGGQGFGVGATAAAFYKLNSQWSMGLNYRSAVNLNYEGRAHFGEEVEGTPFEQRFVDQDITTELTVPHTVNLGLGYQATEALWVGLDLNYMTWSTYDRIEINFDEQSPEGEPGESEPPTVVESNWNDALAVRLGAQFAITDALKARVGFAYDVTPVPDETVGPSLPDNNRTVGALGLGYEVAGFRADVAYQYIYLPTREIRNGSVDGDYQLSSHLVGINVGYGF
ncbi:hypothetical protein DV096_03585 [Bradymonadaceae bacterium TMQ3]|nr:hypothetical protein DV096_03585 [Bradymonadaceae bacterium TMQ3]TXC77597.1 outer membrane beta-barrel protein [Bradymonadales bacterium TMQ1]